MRTTLLITKEKIISVAQKLFIETSFYRTTMKDIARAAKVSRRTLYTHFNSKEDIFNHIVDQKIELIEQKLPRYQIKAEYDKAGNLHLISSQLITE